MSNGPISEVRTLSRSELQSRLDSATRSTGLVVGGERVVRGSDGALRTEREERSRTGVVRDSGGFTGRVAVDRGGRVVDGGSADDFTREQARVAADTGMARPRGTPFLMTDKGFVPVSQAFADRFEELRGQGELDRVVRDGERLRQEQAVRNISFGAAGGDRILLFAQKDAQRRAVSQAEKDFFPIRTLGERTAVGGIRDLQRSRELTAAEQRTLSKEFRAAGLGLRGTARAGLGIIAAAGGGIVGDRVLRRPIAVLRGRTDDDLMRSRSVLGVDDNFRFQEDLSVAFALGGARTVFRRPTSSSVVREFPTAPSGDLQLFRAPAISRRAVIERGVPPESPAALLFERPTGSFAAPPRQVFQTTFRPPGQRTDSAVLLRRESARMSLDADVRPVSQRFPAETAGMDPRQSSLTQFFGVQNPRPFVTRAQAEQAAALRSRSTGRLFDSSRDVQNTFFGDFESGRTFFTVQTSLSPPPSRGGLFGDRRGRAALIPDFSRGLPSFGRLRTFARREARSPIRQPPRPPSSVSRGRSRLLSPLSLIPVSAAGIVSLPRLRPNERLVQIPRADARGLFDFRTGTRQRPSNITGLRLSTSTQRSFDPSSPGRPVIPTNFRTSPRQREPIRRIVGNNRSQGSLFDIRTRSGRRQRRQNRFLTSLTAVQLGIGATKGSPDGFTGLEVRGDKKVDGAFRLRL